MPRRVLGPAMLLVFAFVHALAIPATGQTDGQRMHEFCGLYYGDWNGPESDPVALEISPDGKPIPPKANDPDAPTQPGLHVGQRNFQFLRSRLSSQGFSFRTVSANGTEFSFHGRFGREDVGSLSNVPYLQGILTEKKDGRVVRTKSVHFGHAVVL